jgi:hypothetical protein
MRRPRQARVAALFELSSERVNEHAAGGEGGDGEGDGEDGEDGEAERAGGEAEGDDGADEDVGDAPPHPSSIVAAINRFTRPP